MKSMIKNSSISYSSIKEDIKSYISSLNNYSEIKDRLPDSTINVVIELMAGYSAYNLHNNQMMRQETYLSTAKLDTSVYNIAKAFGYYISRATSPKISLRYISVPSFPLKSGTKVGTYLDLDVVYFGPDRLVEKLDEITFSIGIYSTVETLVHLDDGEFIFDISPLTLKAVDNDCLQLYLNDSPKPLSKAIEDYVIRQKAVDYSLDNKSTRLFISDMENQYGLVVSDNTDMVKVNFLETEGYLSEIRVPDLKLSKDFMYLSVSHYGSDGESLSKIKRLAPLFYSTLRRAVTADDISYIAESHYLCKNAFAERDLGVPISEKLELISWESQEYLINIKGVVYQINTDANDTEETALLKVYEKIKRNVDSVITIDMVNKNIIATAVDSRANVYFIVSSDNILKTNLNENITPACCTVFIYYIKYNTVDVPIAFTVDELEVITKYMYDFKMAGQRLIFTPAEVVYRDFKVKVKLSNSEYYEQVLNALKEILAKYELRLNTGFSYGSVLVELSKVQILVSDEIYHPVTSVEPNQDIFNMELNKYSYIKFQNIEIELV